MSSELPAVIANEAQLDDLLSEPTAAAVASLADTPGDVLLLGAGGKMGLSLAAMIRRAADVAGSPRRVVAASRFSNPQRVDQLEASGVETISADLLDPSSYRELPDAAVVIAMTGSKFGTASNPAHTWATNVLMPSYIASRFAASTLLAFSTGNVYPLVDNNSSGCRESDACGPVGEYAMSALGRERIYDFAGQQQGTLMALLRLNYAVEMRYGVLVDIAQRVWDQQPIDVSMGWVNVIWQGDACAMAIAALRDVQSPPYVLNIAGPERLSVRELAQAFGEQFEKPVTIVGQEQSKALLSDGSLGHRRYGTPRVAPAQMVSWISHWIREGNARLGKPTHFEVTDGGF